MQGERPIVLSHYQVGELLKARSAGKAFAQVSPDLGLSAVEVALGADGVLFPSGATLRWEDAASILRNENKCYVLDGSTIEPVSAFSEVTGWVRSLMPTLGAPTTLVSGLAMHRIKGTGPMKDTLAKVRTIAPIVGRVLDTATGLGYTAIEAARTAEKVVTIELDPVGLEIARLNPWSRDIFENPKIEVIVGDAVEVVAGMEGGSFSRIIHDPPAFALGGEMYSAAFYVQLHRVLKQGGRLFHYIGDLDSKSGRVVTKGVMRRLEDAGFAGITRKPEAFGLIARR